MSTSLKIQTKEAGKKPTGSEFILDRCDFKFGEQIDVEAISIDDDKLTSWPMLYILANQDKAYVGQTTSIKTRMTQHSANEERKDFDTCNVIFNEQFNTSVITDYEHRLICSMQADGKYQLTNKNDGMASSNYYSKEEYDAMFEDLWANMQSWNLAQHSLDEIEESEVFKYSPFKSLTPDQRVALDKIMETIKADIAQQNPIVIEGMPGTGKTVLAIYLLKALKDDPKFKDWNIRLMEPITALKKTLQGSLKGISNIKPSDIIGPSDINKSKFGYHQNKEKSFDILLVDEAHKLKRRKNLGAAFGGYDNISKSLNLQKETTQLDWILNQCKIPIFFYDPLQSIGPSGISEEYFHNKIPNAFNNKITLDSQMRVKGGKQYLQYIQDILNCKNPSPLHFRGYEFALHNDINDFIESFETTYQQHSLSRVLSGYGWQWVSKNDSNKADINIDNVHLFWNCTNENWVGKGFDNNDIAHEVGCIHSIQGYDLSSAYVIIGDDIKYNASTNQIYADKDNYFDRNGKATATPEELTQYLKNIYYVLLTRGILSTHVYAVNPGMRKYLKQFLV